MDELELHLLHHSNSEIQPAICPQYQQVSAIGILPATNLIIFTDTQQKIRLSGVIIVLYNSQEGPPARMYMLVADKDGVAGVTVWGDTVTQIMDTPDVIGRAVDIPGCSLSLYNGKRSLNVPRNHSIRFPDNSPHSDWWEGLIQAESVCIQQMQALPDHSIANLFAVCAAIRREEKAQGMIIARRTGIAVISNNPSSQRYSENSDRLDNGR